MIFDNKFDKKFFFFLLILVISLKSFTFNLPYHWDENVYVYYARYYENYGPLSIPPKHDGHVPFFMWILAFFYRIFGESTFLTHFIEAVFSFLGSYFVYLLGKFLFNRRVGIIASLLLFFSPAYFSLSGQASLDVPLITLTLMVFYFTFRKKTILYLILASILVLIKEPGIFVIIAIVIYQIIKKEKLQNILIYSLPISLIFIWNIWYKFNTGFYAFELLSGFYETHGNSIYSILFPSGISIILKKAMANLYQIFFWNYGWILTLILILNRHKFRFDKKFILLILTAFLYFLYFSYGPLLQRYLLPIYPVFFIFSAYSLNLFKRRAWLLIFLILILFISCYRWNWGIKGFIQDPVFRSSIFYPKTLTSIRSDELSLDYIDIVEIQKEAFDFIFTNYSNSTIVATSPFVNHKSIKVVDYGYRQWMKHDINVLSPSQENINKSDLIIYESYGDWPKGIDIDNLISQMQLIKKFEKNNKYILIFKPS